MLYYGSVRTGTCSRWKYSSHRICVWRFRIRDTRILWRPWWTLRNWGYVSCCLSLFHFPSFSDAYMFLWQTFVAQCKEDINVLNYHINDSTGLGCKAKIVTWYRDYNEHQLTSSPMSREEVCFVIPFLSLVECNFGVSDASLGVWRIRFGLCWLSGRLEMVFEARMQFPS